MDAPEEDGIVLRLHIKRMLLSVLSRRPFLVTPWAIWIHPRLKIRYRYIKFFIEHGPDEAGRIRIQIVDEIDRDYWVRLNRRQYWIFEHFRVHR